MFFMLFFFFKQKSAYEMRISDWSSDVCSSDLCAVKRGAEADSILHQFDRTLRDYQPAAGTTLSGGNLWSQWYNRPELRIHGAGGHRWSVEPRYGSPRYEKLGGIMLRPTLFLAAAMQIGREHV